MFTLTQDSMHMNICQIKTESDHSQIQELANLVRSLKATKYFFTSKYVRELHTAKQQKQLKKVSVVQNRCTFQNANKY